MHRKLLFSKDEVFITGVEAMVDDILLHAQHAMGDGHRIKYMEWDYRLVNGPVATLHVIAPDGTSYSAGVRHTDEGWTLDHISKWRKSEKQPKVS